MTQHVALDLGNVILEFDMSHFWQLSSEIGVNQEDMERYIRLFERSDFCGLVEIRDVIEDEFDGAEAEELISAWSAGIKLNEQMMNFLLSIKHEGFKIAYLSNIGFEHLRYIRKNFTEMMSLAAIQHMSCEVGVAKPSCLYYQSFLMQNDDFSGCVYLEDRKENVIAATKCKFDSILFDLKKYNKQPPSVLKKELDRIKDRLLRS